MGMDRNTVIGFVLLALLFFGYFYYTSQGKEALEKQQKHVQDSLNRLTQKIDTSAKTVKVTGNAPATKDSASSNIEQDTTGKEQFFTLENKVLKITFTNKGGQPQRVELKNFKTFDK